MDAYKNLVVILLSSVLVNNYVLNRFMGICPFLGVSKKLGQAVGMGVSVTVVMLLASAATWPIHYLFLDRLGLGYLQTIVFILIIASLVQSLEILLKRFSPALHQGMGVYLPLITTNCAVLGVALVNVQNDYSFLFSVVNGAAGGIGFTIAIVLFASLRERVDKAECPVAFKGYPIALIAAGLLALAFMGFSGMKIF